MTVIKVRDESGLDQKGNKEVVGFGCILKVELTLLQKLSLVARSFWPPPGSPGCVSLLLCLEGGFRNKSEKCWLAMLSLRPSLEPWIICVHPPFLCTVPHTSLSPGPTFCSGQPTICSQSLSPQCPLPTKILPILQGSLPAPLYEHCPPGRDTH